MNYIVKTLGMFDSNSSSSLIDIAGKSMWILSLRTTRSTIRITVEHRGRSRACSSTPGVTSQSSAPHLYFLNIMFINSLIHPFILSGHCFWFHTTTFFYSFLYKLNSSAHFPSILLFILASCNGFLFFFFTKSLISYFQVHKLKSIHCFSLRLLYSTNNSIKYFPMFLDWYGLESKMVHEQSFLFKNVQTLSWMN